MKIDIQDQIVKKKGKKSILRYLYKIRYTFEMKIDIQNQISFPVSHGAWYESSNVFNYGLSNSF